MREWFLCLIETKGNFYINVGFRNGRIFVQPVFTLSMKKEDLNVLEELKREIGVGEIKVGRNAIFSIRGMKNLLRFLGKIKEEELITSKRRDFILWKEAVQLVKEYKHLSKEGFLRICEIRDRMNLKKKRKSYKSRRYFEELIERLNLRFENEKERRKISSSLRATYGLKSYS